MTPLSPIEEVFRTLTTIVVWEILNAAFRLH